MKKHSIWIASVVMASVALMAIGLEARSQKKDEPRVAQVKDLMAGINKPHMQRLQRAVQAGGPRNEEEWNALAISAALINENGFVLMQDGRCPDSTWATACANLRAATTELAEAVAEKSFDGVKAALPKIGVSCKSCHDVHRDDI